MSGSDSDVILPSSQELDKAAEDEEKKRKLDSDSLHSDDDSGKENRSAKKIQRSGVLMVVNETEKEFKYRKKQFKDPDSVITNRKLRCTACCCSLQSVVLEGRDIFRHPVLKVLMCKTCSGFYGNGDFSIDEDGSDKYCRWCGQGGTLYCCALCCCAFCKKCIKRNLSRSILGDIESEEWKCFVCDGTPLWELRAICANAETVSRKIRRKRREEQEHNLKQLQKKGPPGKRKGRRLNRWQNKSAIANSSSGKETNTSESSSEENTKSKKSKRPPSRNKRKRDSCSSSSDVGRNDKKKKKKQENSNSDVAEIESEKECILLSDTDDDTNKSAKKNQSEIKKGQSSSKAGSEDDKMPDEVDSEGVKEAQELFQEHLTDLVHTGELIAYRAKRLLEKKIDEKSMVDPEKVKKVVGSINLLVKLSRENMEHTLDFLNSRYKHWVKVVKRKHKHSKLNTKPTEIKSEKGTSEEQKEEISRETENSVIKENIHVNGVMIGRVESSDENDKLKCKELSDLEVNNEELPLKDNEMEHDKNKETKNEDNSTISTVEGNEADKEKHLTNKSIKRKKRNDSSEETLDDNDSNANTVGKDEQVTKKSKRAFQIDEGSSHHNDDSCEEGMKRHSNSENDKDDTSEKNNDREQDHSHNEKVEKEQNSASKHNGRDSPTVSFSSLSTLMVDQNNSLDLFHDSKQLLDVTIEEEKLDEKDGNGIHEVPKQKEKDGDSSDTPTVELMHSPISASDKSEIIGPITESQSGVKEGEGKQDNGRESEERCNGVEEQNVESCDPLSLSEPINNNLKESKVRDDIKKRVISESCDSDDKHSNLETVEPNKVCDDISDDDSKTSFTNSKPDDVENKEIKKSVDYTDDCLEAQQTLLGYTSDDEAEDEDRPKKKKGQKKKTKKDVDSKVEDNITNNLKKRRIGPKSRTRQFRSSSSSASDEESDGSSPTKHTKHENSKKKKFRLKDTEAYKQDKKLGWKCNVEVKKLTEDEFQKFYENYFTCESSKSEEETRDDKEILSLLNLKSLKKGSGKKSQDNSNESETEESDDYLKKKKKAKPKKDKAKEQEQRLIDLFNKEDEEADIHDTSPSPNLTGGEDITKLEMKNKTLIEKENEMAMKLLLGSSSSEDEGLQGSQDEAPEETKKMKKKSKKKDVDIEASDASMDEKKPDSKEPEDIEQEKEEKEHKEHADMIHEDEEKDVNKEEKDGDDNKEEKDDNKEEKDDDNKEEKDEKIEEEKDADKEKKGEDDDNNDEKKDDKDDNDEKKDDDDDDDDKKEEKDDKKTKKEDSSESELDKPKKKDWRKDKLLTEKLTDLDTSDEERLWKTKKEKEKKFEDSKKKARRRILGSDDDDDDEIKISSSDSSCSSDSDIFVTKRKKKKKKKSDSDFKTSNDSDSDFQSKKPKRRRIRAPASDSSSNDEDSPNLKSTPGKGRKKIHHIMSDDNVAEATRKAAKEEEERRKRISEKQKMYNEIYKVVEGVQKLDKLVLDFDPETKKELVSVDTDLVPKLKPHQAKGVKFMWDACFESLKQIEKTKGSGCILAHCMGLGKTFQIVTLVHTLLNHKKTQVNTVLVVCPLSTVHNWVNEFNMWLKDGEEVNIYELSRYKQNYERMYQLKDWQESGGVMVLGYEMYRNLTNPQAKRLRKKAIETFQSSLVDPGPDLVVCDEGHLLKNEDSAIAKAMKRIKTLRRIVLTGTPLQNNLKEYHCMVQFVKPNLLGTRREFLNRFVNPITNGQFEDSTLHDVKIMKRRAHVLHKMLEGSVQRFDYSVLTPFLPPKHEYVISIRLTEFQVKAYRHYLAFISKRTTENKGAQLFTDFQNLQRVFTHPRVLMMSTERQEKQKEKKRLMESDSEGSLKDFIDDDDETSDSSSSSNGKSSSDEDDNGDNSDVQAVDGKKANKPSKSSKNVRNTRSRGLPEEPEIVEVEKEEDKGSPEPWWKQFIQEESAFENINDSGKLVLLFSILRECEKIGDKV